MSKACRFVVVCALAGLVARCSVRGGGLGMKYDASPGGARDSGADRAQAGGTTGGTTGAGGRAGSGGSAGSGGNQGKDAALACSADAGKPCCYRDGDCVTGEACVGATCTAKDSIAGVCKSTATLVSGQCWRDADCPTPPGKCQSASICGCGMLCIVADTPGTCAK